jgi:hypothetical protein
VEQENSQGGHFALLGAGSGGKDKVFPKGFAGLLLFLSRVQHFCVFTMGQRFAQYLCVPTQYFTFLRSICAILMGFNILNHQPGCALGSPFLSQFEPGCALGSPFLFFALFVSRQVCTFWAAGTRTFWCLFCRISREFIRRVWGLRKEGGAEHNLKGAEDHVEWIPDSKLKTYSAPRILFFISGTNERQISSAPGVAQVFTHRSYC